MFVRSTPTRYTWGYKRSKNKKLVYELFPDYYIESLNARISSQGLNDRFFTRKKPTNVFRIAVVGDSASFGWKVGQKSSFPKILENILNRREKGRYEVINFSVPGYNTAQEYELIKSKVLDFHPDMVILVFSGNDFNAPNYLQPKITPINYLYNRSYLIRFVLRYLDKRILPISDNHWIKRKWVQIKRDLLGMFYYGKRIYPYPGLEVTDTIKGDNPPRDKENVPKEYWYMLGRDNYKIHLSHIRDLLKRKNVAFISSGFLGHEVYKIHNELGIEYIFSFTDGTGMKTFRSYPLSNKDIHMNIKGHALVADAFYDFLKANNLLPSP